MHRFSIIIIVITHKELKQKIKKLFYFSSWKQRHTIAISGSTRLYKRFYAQINRIIPLENKRLYKGIQSNKTISGQAINAQPLSGIYFLFRLFRYFFRDFSSGRLNTLLQCSCISLLSIGGLGVSNFSFKPNAIQTTKIPRTIKILIAHSSVALIFWIIFPTAKNYIVP